ncbi:MAG: preprotein translocase subunit Sec61beta [Candidatus Aenigmarchaeota archaeon]|nr:preprotein translocase subunit Sec61beta [Candidatus Aenigmarchaeota archaeon]
MADNRIHIPSSQGGLVRYFDDYKSKIELRPEYVIAAIVLVIAVEIVLHSL